MPRVARAPAIPPPPPLPALSLVLTGQVYLVSVKKGRLLSPGPVLNLDKVGGSTLGKNGESSDTWTSVGKQNGLVLFTEIFLNHRPSGIWGSYMDSPHLKQPTVHARGRFPGRSPFKPGDHPHQRSFLRTVNAWSGTERYKATCHPRLGGACEAIGLVRVAQAGVAGAALARDVKKGVQPMMPRRPPRDAGNTGTTAAGRPGAAATARPGCGELNPKGSPPRPAVAGRVSVGAGGRLRRGGWRRRR